MAGVSILAAAVLTACSGSHAEEAGMPPPPQVSVSPSALTLPNALPSRTTTPGTRSSMSTMCTWNAELPK